MSFIGLVHWLIAGGIASLRNTERLYQPQRRNAEELSVKNLSRFFVLVLLTAFGTGCVYVNGEQIDAGNWQEIQHTNREAISQLQLGTTTQAVKDKLGSPVDSEAFMKGDSEIRVLFYRTTHKHSDGETSRDETTPLVFENDSLVGWGTTVYEAQSL